MADEKLFELKNCWEEDQLLENGDSRKSDLFNIGFN